MTEASLFELWRSLRDAGRLAPTWAVVVEPERYDAVARGLADLLELTAADVIAVEPEPGKRTLGRSLVVDWISRAQLAPRGQRQLAVLRSAETMPAVVANALLKTLEEPPAGTVFLLLMSRDALLPTIRSRVQLIGLDQTDGASGSLPSNDLSDMLKWASGAIEQDSWPQTVSAVTRAVRQGVRDGRLTGEEADRALALVTSTTAGLNRKLQLVSLLAKLQA